MDIAVAIFSNLPVGPCDGLGSPGPGAVPLVALETDPVSSVGASEHET
jgi:hypothetical protein